MLARLGVRVRIVGSLKRIETRQFRTAHGQREHWEHSLIVALRQRRRQVARHVPPIVPPDPAK